jgi:hypothetical protein
MGTLGMQRIGNDDCVGDVQPISSGQRRSSQRFSRPLRALTQDGVTVPVQRGEQGTAVPSKRWAPREVLPSRAMIDRSVRTDCVGCREPLMITSRPVSALRLHHHGRVPATPLNNDNVGAALGLVTFK